MEQDWRLPAVKALLNRLHILVGLFSLTSLIVFAATGIAVTIPVARGPAITRVVDYEAPGSLSDKDVADDVLRTLALPLASPIPAWAVHRNAQNVLVLNFYTPNGDHTVTLLEAERKARVEQARTSLGQFLDAMHGTTFHDSAPDLRIRLWALYVDCSMFSLLFMTITGPWLWLLSRPRLWWAHAAFAAGAGIFVVLWFVTR